MIQNGQVVKKGKKVKYVGSGHATLVNGEKYKVVEVLDKGARLLINVTEQNPSGTGSAGVPNDDIELCD